MGNGYNTWIKYEDGVLEWRMPNMPEKYVEYSQLTLSFQAKLNAIEKRHGVTITIKSRHIDYGAYDTVVNISSGPVHLW